MSKDIKNAYPGHHQKSSGVSSNWLRAAVLGANDGIVSVASIVVGVAGASSSRGFVITAGIAGLVAGAASMAVGEFISVSSQRDMERALLKTEEDLLQNYPNEEKAELALLYESKGISKRTSQLVADELSKNNAASAHFDAELGIDPSDLTNPWHAALASAAAFTAGALVPMLAAVFSSASARVPYTFIAVLIALIVTGTLSAKASHTKIARPTARVVIGGFLAMTLTFVIGKVLGVHSI